MDEIGELTTLFSGRRLFVLVGAGCSTESGIPDYRGPKTQKLARNPIQYRAFVDDPTARRRYWARSAVGWRAVSQALPNPAHQALAQLEHQGLTPGIVTQNVDGLHQMAGSRSVVELHGALREVCCLDCGAIEARSALQLRIEALNPNWLRPDRHREAPIAPDGDSDLDPGEDFVVPVCVQCGGTLKPNVVFFGENVPRPRVEACYSWLGDCDAVLVVGSSLTVFSGYRFVKRASERSLPIGIVNLGPTRAQPLATLHVDGPAGQVVPALVERLTGRA